MQKRSLIHFLKEKPLFLILLPVFFVLHGLILNFGSVAVPDAFWLTLIYIASAVILAAISYLIFRNITKACLFSCSLMFFNFFFGALQDGLKNAFPGSILGQYRFLLPFFLVVFFLIIFLLKKRKTPLNSVVYFLNLLLLALIFTEGVLQATRSKSRVQFAAVPDLTRRCDTCSRPDIYLLLLDQYPGTTALQQVFDFDNHPFDSALGSRGFHIVKESRSNYNLTPFSMGSLLNMQYLGPGMGVKGNLNVNYSYNAVRKNQIVRFLRESGYTFHNFSVFDFPGQPAKKYKTFFPYGTALITYQTFTSRISKDIERNILNGNLKLEGMRRKIAYQYLKFNDAIYDHTVKVATRGMTAPKFVYAHFMMPHWPYYFDKTGKPAPIEKLAEFRRTNAADFVEYLQYCNSKVLELSDRILAGSTNPPIIILLGDHGFRHPEKASDPKYDFSNLNAIYLPNRNYAGFYAGMSNVNLFRVLLNTCFDQQLELLKDSTINLYE